MKINKLSKKQINEWLGKNLPDDLSELNFTKMFQDFQQSIIKANLEPYKIVKAIVCQNCGTVHETKTLTVIDRERYVRPSGCTDGDYYKHVEYYIECKGCHFDLEIPATVWSHMQYEKMVKNSSTNFLHHKPCKFLYKTIYL